MKFSQTKLGGAYIVDIERLADERGFFARTWCEREFEAQGLRSRMVQNSVSFNKKKGTLRGLHYHAAPFKQARLVRCVAGSAFAVIVDLRPRLTTFTQHVSVTLTAELHRALYVPPGLALGYQTLENDTEIYYQMPEFYDPVYERGVRWNDPAFGIQWPEDKRIILERDGNYPNFETSIVADFAKY